MKYLNYFFLIFLISNLAGFLQAQPVEARRELEKVQRAIERTEAVLQLLPGDINSDVRNTLTTRLNEARQKFQQAVEFVELGQFQRAKIAIAQVYSLLKQIERLIRTHPVFKIKFQEQLDRKIHQADELIGNGRNEEALYMLNRAKFYRRRAYSLSNQGDRPYAALEYYRLALHFADQAIRLGSGARSDLDRESLRSLYFETEMLLKRAGALLDSRDASKQIVTMLRRADTELLSARTLFEKGELKLAQQKLVTVNRIVYRIMDMMERRPEREKDRIEFDLEGLQFSLNTLEQQVNPQQTPAAYRLLGRIRKLLEEVNSHVSKQQMGLARRKLRIANQLVLKLSHLIERPAKTDPELLTENLRALRQELTALSSSGQSQPAYQPLYKLIEQNLDETEQQLNRQNYLAASRLLKLSRQLVYQLNRLMNRNQRSVLGRDIAEVDLEQLRILLARIQNSAGNDEAFGMQYRNAKKLYTLAEQAFKEGKYNVCSEYAKLGINFLTK